MDRNSIDKMKFDRRLVRRQDWVTRDELEKQLEALPDVSHKVATDDDSPKNSPEGDTPEPERGSKEPLS